MLANWDFLYICIWCDSYAELNRFLVLMMKFKPEEITAIMNDFAEPGTLAPTGLHLGGTKYMVIQGEPGAVIRGKKVNLFTWFVFLFYAKIFGHNFPSLPTPTPNPGWRHYPSQLTFDVSVNLILKNAIIFHPLKKILSLVPTHTHTCTNFIPTVLIPCRYIM